MIDVVERARIFATAAHAAVSQRRKYTNEDYIVHPAEVVSIVKSVKHTPEMLAAAWLHDTVEDTGLAIDDIATEFGDAIASMVYWLTDVSKPEHGNREVRKAIDREHSANAPPDVQTIKLADIISNSSTILHYDPKFAKVYLKEKQLLLAVMNKGDSELLVRAHSIVIDL